MSFIFFYKRMMNGTSFNLPKVFATYSPFITKQCVTNNDVISADCFVKSPEEQANVKNIAKLDYFKSVYDSVYDEIIYDMARTNPLILTLNLNKPSLRLISDEDRKKYNFSGVASYNYTENIIQINDNFDQRTFVFIEKNENGSISEYYIVNEEEYEELKQSLISKNRLFDVFELSDEEIEFSLKATLAHELRHYIQEHLVASLSASGDKIRNKYLEEYLSFEKNKFDYIESCKQENKIPDLKVISQSLPTYWIEYIPNKIAENSLFKFTSNTNDNRYWSITDDFANLSRKLSGRTNEDFMYYYGRPTEIDAYNYELEYYKKIS